MDNTENSKQLAVEKSRSETVDYGEILKQMTLEEKASLCSGKRSGLRKISTDSVFPPF